MATVGQQLKAPEAGWSRHDDTDFNINYIGTWEVHNDSYPYNGSYHSSPGIGSSANFNFRGTKLRIIGFLWSQETTSMLLYIDGQLKADFNEYEVQNPVNQCLICEITGLSSKEHSVQIVNNASGYATLDAIDIDEDGELKPYNPIETEPEPNVPAPINLVAVAGDSKVMLSWDTVTGAIGYNVKRSTTAGGPYTIIASIVPGTSYVDTAVINSTTYYYIVTAITADGESDKSNEASATPAATESPGENGQALLRVTMTDSSEREYKLPMTEINSFVAWMDRPATVGTSFYTFDKIITESKEYLLFDKIISFEVTEIK